MTDRRGWHPEDIKAAVRKKGKTLRSLGAECGLSLDSVRKALKTPFRSAEKVIVDFLEVPPNELWPDRYDADGRRLISHSRRKTSRPGRPRHRQNGEAA